MSRGPHRAARRAAASRQDPLDVLMVTPRFFPASGGVQTHVYEVARRLIDTGVHVEVLTADATRSLPPHAEIDGISVTRVPAWPGRADLYLAPGIALAIRARRPDLVHVQGIHSFVPPLAMIGAITAGVPFIVSFHTGGHSSPLRQRLRRLQWGALAPLLRRAAALVAVADFEASIFRTVVNRRRPHIVVIPNGVDPVAAVPRTVRRPSSGPVIVSVGRLERYKGHHRILAAMPAILARHGGAHLRVVGEGPYRGRLEAMAVELEVGDHVEIGSVPAGDRQAMASILAEADVVTLLSEYEAHPVAVMEALAQGHRVVVAGTSGLKELADRGLATAIPLDAGPQAVADAVDAALDAPEVPIAVGLPTWDESAARLLDVYRQTVS